MLPYDYTIMLLDHKIWKTLLNPKFTTVVLTVQSTGALNGNTTTMRRFIVIATMIQVEALDEKLTIIDMILHVWS